MDCKINGKIREMNILYIISDDIAHNTSANIRNVSLIRGLIDVGNCVQVIFLYHGKKRDKSLIEAISDSKLTCLNTIVERPNAVQSGSRSKNVFVQQGRKVLTKVYNCFRVYDQYKIKVKSLKIDTSKIIPPDLIISSSDPRSSHLLALKIIKSIKYQGKYVQYWGDPMSTDISSSRLVKILLMSAERRLLARADKIIYTNHTIVSYINQKYGIPMDRICEIPTSNVFSITQNKYDKNTQIKDHIVLGYFGGFFKQTRNMKPLFDAVVHNSKYKLILAGLTDWEIPACDRIEYFDHLSADKIAELQDGIDALIVMENIPRSDMGGCCLQIPGKVYHYGLSRNKVLVIMETGICKNEFEHYNRYFFSNNNADAISNAIEDLVKDSTLSYATPLQEFYPKSVATFLVNQIYENGY